MILGFFYLYIILDIRYESVSSPSWTLHNSYFTGLPFTLMVMLNSIEECKSLPKVSSLSEHHEAAHAEAGTRNGKIIWLAFAFESVSYHIF